MTTAIWFLVLKIVALTHFGSELTMAPFASKESCLEALIALQAGHPINPYALYGIDAIYQQRNLDFLFCTDSAESGG